MIPGKLSKLTPKHPVCRAIPILGLTFVQLKSGCSVMTFVCMQGGFKEVNQWARG